MEVGEFVSARVRVVDVWAAGRRLTVDDNAAYVPSFCHAFRSAARRFPVAPFAGCSPEQTFRLLDEDRDGFQDGYRFFEWTEIVDNVSGYRYLDGDLVLVFSFWRPSHPVPAEVGRVFVARVCPVEFTSIVEAVVESLCSPAPGG
ncbi:hypothetical protein [Actinoplanes sichuanensis]|uniref:Uncharacterized protein n=1 Tax=Actinoplanes sichuanensis TaxID=512349 RepID=A0ABW4APT5_9ACTN|nr:hypothetical protein [Actinoplanes sichuanensis]